MLCHEVQERLSAWLDGEVAEDVSQEIAAHVAGCSACRRETALLQRLQEALRHLEAPSAPDVTAQVLARLPRQAPPKRWWQSLALAASLLLGVFLGHTVTGSLYLVHESEEVADVATLEILQDFPQGSWGALLVTYSTEEGNGL